MPYRTEWVPNEIAAQQGGVVIFHAYNDNDANDPAEFWFTLHDGASENFAFDIRDWRGYNPLISPELNLQQAIAGGALYLLGASVFIERDQWDPRGWKFGEVEAGE